MILIPDQTTRGKINEIECYLSYLLQLYLLLTSFLLSPFFTFFTGQRHLQSNIFEINFSSRKSQSAFFSFGAYIKVVKLVASHFFVSFSCSLSSPSVDQSHSKYLVATADESDLGNTRETRAQLVDSSRKNLRPTSHRRTGVTLCVPHYQAQPTTFFWKNKLLMFEGANIKQKSLQPEKG